MIPAFTEISHGTLQPADLARALLPYVERYALHPGAVHDLAAAADEGLADEWAEIFEEALEDLDNVTDAYCYIGFHEGDGSLLGVWPDVERAQEELENFNCRSEIPADFRGHALEVNERGNTTLLVVSPEYGATEIWSIV